MCMAPVFEGPVVILADHPKEVCPPPLVVPIGEQELYQFLWP